MSSDLTHFVPYLLNQASELVSAQFQPNYRDRYGMLRTEWRVLFHLGHRGNMTAKDICSEAILHKTKVSRAVNALQSKGFLNRQVNPDDRRVELLSLTCKGQSAFDDLSGAAAQFEKGLAEQLTAAELEHLRRLLLKLMNSETPK
ncbi:MAG: MarR family winged helix-turn-helix transcriptional regulator [Roseobacter sp.]